MFTNSKLAKSVKLACAFSAASAFSFSGAVQAQEEQEAVAVEKIEVTGSRIKRTDLEGAAPVVSITAADIKLEGDFTVADALRSSSPSSLIYQKKIELFMTVYLIPVDPELSLCLLSL